MFGFGLQKLLVLALVVGAVWYGFKFFGRLDASRQKVGKAARAAPDKVAGGQAEAAAAQDMERCETCGDFVAERVIRDWIDFYNTERPHSALAGRTPAEAYGAGRPVDMMDKPDGLPTSPQVQQRQKDVINGILAA